MTFPATTTNVDEYSYNHADQLSEVSMKKKAEVLASMAYTRDKIGRPKKTPRPASPKNRNANTNTTPGTAC